MSIMKSLIRISTQVSSLYSTMIRSSHASLYSTVATPSEATLSNLIDPPTPGTIFGAYRHSQMEKSFLASPDIREMAAKALENDNIKTLEFVDIVNGYFEYLSGSHYDFIIKVKDVESGDHRYVHAYVFRRGTQPPIYHTLESVPEDQIHLPPPSLLN